MTNTTTHTAATLAALPPRELDALAETIVMGNSIRWSNASRADPDDDNCIDFYESLSGVVIEVFTVTDRGVWNTHNYSTSLDAAALLEAELARRNVPYIMSLLDVLDDTWNLFEDWAYAKNMLRIATASAKQRTIAAILAAQEAK